MKKERRRKVSGAKQCKLHPILEKESERVKKKEEDEKENGTVG